MLDSVRTRLALWHTAVLAVMLAAFATATDLWIERAASRREDSFLEESSQTLRSNIIAELEEVPLDTAIQQALAEFQLRNVAFFVVDSTNRRFGPAHPPVRRRHTAMPRVEDVTRVIAAHRQTFETVGESDDAIRLFVLPTTVGRHSVTVVAAESLSDQQELLEDTRAGFLIAIPIGLLLAWLGGNALARRSLAPVSTMTARAAEIGATSLHERLPVGNPRDELGQLATVFNDLLARLDAAFEQQRRFMADASHELRTPVAIMRGEADIALSRTVRSADEYRGALEVVRAEGRRLSRIVGDLFLLARADAGQQPLARRELYLDELVSDCARAVRSLALGRAVTVRCSIDPPMSAEMDRLEGAPAAPEHAYRGDEELLCRLLVNLLDNAIKHAPAGSTVDVDLTSDARGHRLVITDRGAGIPTEARAHVFERFYRADAAHVRVASETGGAGLGLAIARWVAEAHGGSLDLIDSRPGRTVFEAWLPRMSAHSSEEPVDA